MSVGLPHFFNSSYRVIGQLFRTCFLAGFCDLPWVSIVMRVRGIVCAMYRPLFRSSTIDRVWRYMVSTLTFIVIISAVLDTETSIDPVTLTQLCNNNMGGNGQVIIPLTASSVVRSECDKRIRKSTLSLLAQKVIQTKHF